MGIEIKQGLDNTIDDALNITGSATGWASRQKDVLEALKSTSNELGSAALLEAVLTATADAVPKTDSAGLIPVALLPTATVSGGANAGKIPSLDTNGYIPAALIQGSTGGGSGGGLKGLWWYSDSSSLSSSIVSADSNRQYVHTWTPGNTGITTALIVATGGGGSGSYAPASQTTRKGGGGAGGSTVIAFRSGITTGTSWSIKVGAGGNNYPSSTPAGSHTNFDGAATAVHTDITAGGGGRGNPLGDGGVSATSSFGQRSRGLQIPGGEGGDGLMDTYGAGYGGGTFWGMGYNAGSGRLDTGRRAAFGSGGGAASGTVGGTFTAGAQGKAGNNGVVVILGW